MIPAPDFDWSRQLRDEFDIQAIAAQTHELARLESDRLRWALHYGAVVGNQVIFAHAGAELRYGASGMAAQALRFAATPPLSTAGTPGWNCFVGVSGR